jgi:hypothetical protein
MGASVRERRSGSVVRILGVGGATLVFSTLRQGKHALERRHIGCVAFSGRCVGVNC